MQFKKAEKTLFRSMRNDIGNHVINQKNNAIAIAKNYTAEVKGRMTAYGCNAECVDNCTRDPRMVTRCSSCECPRQISIKVNPEDAGAIPHGFFN